MRFMAEEAPVTFMPLASDMAIDESCCDTSTPSSSSSSSESRVTGGACASDNADASLCMCAYMRNNQ